MPRLCQREHASIDGCALTPGLVIGEMLIFDLWVITAALQACLMCWMTTVTVIKRACGQQLTLICFPPNTEALVASIVNCVWTVRGTTLIHKLFSFVFFWDGSNLILFILKWKRIMKSSLCSESYDRFENLLVIRALRHFFKTTSLCCLLFKCQLYRAAVCHKSTLCLSFSLAWFSLIKARLTASATLWWWALSSCIWQFMLQVSKITQ